MSLIVTKAENSCEMRKVAAHTQLEAGQVAAEVDGLLVPWDPTAGDAAQFPTCVMAVPARPRGTPVEKLAIVRDAEILRDRLVFYGSANDRHKAECLEELARIGIVAK